jgi:hypothetical protein
LDDCKLELKLREYFMAQTNRITWEILRKLDSSTMSSSSTYYNVGSPLLYPSYKLKMVNNSTVLVTVSIDGVNDYDVCPGSSYWLYDETQAQISTSNSPAIPAGTQISCKAASAGTGLIYLVSQYLVVA